VSVALFWIAAGLIAYTYVGYPALLGVRALLRPRPFRCADATPSVTMVICAHDEAAAIGAKLENVLSLDYPRDRLEVLVASDGSTDGTEAIVRALAPRGVRLLALPRRGKIPTLNAAVGEAKGEILVFSDANSMYAPDAIRALVRPFADAEVGGVAGDQRYLAADGGPDGSEGERAYWSFDRKLKEWQSRAGSVTSATGAIYAIRRSLFREVPSGVTDDFVISTRVIAEHQRLVFAPDAVAYEPPARSTGAEANRKVRVMTRGLTAVLVMRELLDPLRHGFYALQLFSHKVLRRLVVLPLILLLGVSPFLWDEGPLYRGFVLLQAAFYAAAGLEALLRTRIRIFSLPLYFCMVNGAALLAATNVVRGRRIDSWQPARTGAAA
jgi:cellulose synthase/poly-beta-1,6-N-acetylglucosamine synthase-like glycosyltransferase